MTPKSSSARLTRKEYMGLWESSHKVVLRFDIDSTQEYAEIKQVLVRHSEFGGISEAQDYGQHPSADMDRHGVPLPKYGTTWQFTRRQDQPSGTYGWGEFDVHAIMDDLHARGMKFTYEFQ